MECHGKWIALKLLILGLAFILITLYTDWNLGVVIGVLLIIKAIIIVLMPMCCKTKAPIARPQAKSSLVRKK